VSIVKNLLKGAVSGYTVRLAQVIISLLMVPFLLQDKMLGLKGYGEVFTLIAILVLISLILDGIKLSQSRFIAKSLDTQEYTSQILGGSIKLVLFITTSIASLISLYPEKLADLAGLSQRQDIIFSLYAICLIFIIENTFYSFESMLHALGRTFFINIIAGIEVIGRNLAIVTYFIFVDVNILVWFIAQLSFIIMRVSIYFFIISNIRSNLLSGIFTANIRSSFKILKYSLPASGRALSEALIYRSAVIASSNFLGPEAAGIVTLVVGTIRNYMVQSLFSIFRPMMIPLMSRISLESLNKEQQNKFKSFSELYTAIIFFTGFLSIAIMPELIQIWLGDNFYYLSPAIQIIILSCILELSASIKNSLLISDGEIKPFVTLDVPLALFCFLGILTGAVYFSWHIIILSVAAYGIISGGIITDHVYRKKMSFLNLDHHSTPYIRLIISLALFLITFGISSLEFSGIDELMRIVIHASIAMILSTIVIHVFIMNLNNAGSFTKQLLLEARPGTMQR